MDSWKQTMGMNGLKERRRRSSDADNEEEMMATKIKEDSKASNKTSSPISQEDHLMSSRMRRPRSQRSFQRSITPMLDMIERASSRDGRQPGFDDDDAQSQESEDSIVTVVDCAMGKRNRVRLNRSASLDSAEYSSSSSSSSSENQKVVGYLSNGKQRNASLKQFDVDQYMARREMSPFQERMNAVTVMPGAFYCIMFLLSGAWLETSLIGEYGAEMMNTNTGEIFDGSQCLSISWMPHLHALPPLPLVAAAVGIVFHAPFSFIYHWKYAHRLPAGFARTNHWSRRMDQAMIHFCSSAMAYATSGRLDFFLANALFNADCIYRQFMKRIRPRRNQVRIFISLVAYTIPIVRRGDVILFSQIWSLLAVSGWLFSQYPIGGWSHTAFHVVMAFVPPLLMTAAIDLPASQEQLKIAAQCAVLANDRLAS